MNAHLHLLAGSLAAAALAGACGADAPATTTGAVTPVYNKQSGRLEALLSDRDGDGRHDTRAVMSGTELARVEIDRNADGRPDRWEYYHPTARGSDGMPLIERAEESDATTGRIARREYFENGVMIRAEEDTDHDGRVDKWETYRGGALAVLELDLVGRGRPSQRLTYGPEGGVIRVDTDPDGDGVFTAVSSGPGR